jgi:hypothetical protein
MPGMNLPPGFDPKDKRYKKFANKLPTRDNCDLDDPREMFLWMYTALPGLNGGQLMFPAGVKMLWSQHQHQLGAMLKCPECGYEKTPEKVYVASTAGDPNWLSSPGRWKAAADAPPSTPDAVDTALDGLAAAQQATILLRLLGRMSPDQVTDILDKHKAGEL